jgi:hypothetical protein
MQFPQKRKSGRVTLEEIPVRRIAETIPIYVGESQGEPRFFRLLDETRSSNCLSLGTVRSEKNLGT